MFVVVGPGGRISTVDCSRVLNVNKSLYGSTSRVERSEPALYAAPTCTTGEAPVYVYNPSVCVFSGKSENSKKQPKILKTSIKDMPPTGDGLL